MQAEPDRGDAGRRTIRQGLVDYLTVLNAQQNLRSSEQQEVQSEQKLYTDIVTLYQALGGGWESTFPVAKNG